MKQKLLILCCFSFAILITCLNANALLISGQDIIAAPGSIEDDTTINNHQQAFNEAQNVLLATDLSVDSGVISAGSLVNSHMIFLNTGGYTFASDPDVVWEFDGEILGVMSDFTGSLEVASSDFLGALGTTYPGSTFNARGMEGQDSYSFLGSTVTVSMFVTEPGDWIRVVTGAGAASPVPEPATMLLFGTGLVGLVGARFRKKKK